RGVLARELGVAPQTGTTALYERLKGGLGELPSNLGMARVGMVGRAMEQERLIAELGDGECRLLTVVGMGGSGKTLLAPAVASHFLRPESLADSGPFSDGVYMIELANLRDAHHSGDGADAGKRQLAIAIAEALGLAPAAADPVAQLITALQGKTLLLVLDS